MRKRWIPARAQRLRRGTYVPDYLGGTRKGGRKGGREGGRKVPQGHSGHSSNPIMSMSLSTRISKGSSAILLASWWREGRREGRGEQGCITPGCRLPGGPEEEERVGGVEESKKGEGRGTMATGV